MGAVLAVSPLDLLFFSKSCFHLYFFKTAALHRCVCVCVMPTNLVVDMQQNNTE